MTTPLIVWQMTDGKRGHERQVEGLLAAMAAQCALTVHRIGVAPTPLARLFDYLRVRTPADRDLPAPDLAIGAGRACQWPLLATRRVHGAPVVYLMRPALPMTWFDLCIVPRHDHPVPRANVIVSEGPLNPLQADTETVRDTGLILAGGPSRHHGWDSTAVLRQVDAIVQARPDLDWSLSDSRRSPAQFATLARSHGGFRFVSHRDCAADWLPRSLARAAQAWVTADSAGMLYEALTAGAEVGVIDVPARRGDRVTAIADELHARGWVRRTADLGHAMPLRAPRLREADRCADLIFARWPAMRRPVTP